MPEAGPETAGGAGRSPRRRRSGRRPGIGHFSDATVRPSAGWLPQLCYVDGMARARVSTTVDSDLLGVARGLRPWGNDASLFDAALQALVARHRAAIVDAAYRAYEDHPLGEADEWGDLDSFRAAAGRS
jgi:hypothetical protein